MGDDETGEALPFCPQGAPLHCAAYQGDNKSMEKFLKKGEDVNMIMCTVPPLYVACLRGYKNVVETLVKYNCDVNATSVELQQTALHCTASKGQDKIAKFLIKHGAVLNQQDTYGATPLFLSSQYGHFDISKCLVESGANVNIADKKGLSPLAIATLNGRTKIAELLIKKRSKLNQQDKQGNTALFHAVKSGQRQICNLLAQAGASVNTPNTDNDYPVTIAAKYGNVIMIENLISKGCNVNVASPNGTPVFLAVQRQHVNALKKLITAGADISKIAGAKQQREPLLEAMHQNKANPYLIRDLIAGGSCVDIQCDCHEVPLHALLSKCNLIAVIVILMCDGKIGHISSSKLDEINITCPILYAQLKNGDQPQRLMALCRKAVKFSIGSVHYQKKIEKLKLPKSVKNYLLYLNIQLPKCNDEGERV